MALALRLFRLGHQSLWIDETFTWLSAGVGGSLTPADLLENVHGPLYGLLIHAWTSLAGDSEWALRLPSALFGAALVPALAWLAALWTGRATAIPAAWLAAASPFLVWYSQEARNYALLMLLVVVASALLLRAREPGRPAQRRVAAATIGATVAGLLSNFTFAFLLPLHARWWTSGSARVRRLAWGAAAVVALALLPWAPQAARTWDWSRLLRAGAAAGEEPLRGSTTFHAAAIPFAFYTFAAGVTLAPSLRELKREPARALGRGAPLVAAATVVFGTLGALGIAALARRRRLGEALLWAGPALAVVSWFAIRNFKVFNPRYLAVVFPLVLLALAAGLADLRKGPRLALGAAVAALWAVSLLHLYFDPRFGKEDYRGAFSRIRARAGAGERVIAVGADHPVAYYNRGFLPLETFWLGFARSPDRLDRELDRARAGASAAWIVLSRGEDLDPEGRFARRMAERFPDAERFEVEGVGVWRVPAGAP